MNNIALENARPLSRTEVGKDWHEESAPPDLSKPKELYSNSRSQSSRNNLIPNVCRAVRIPGTHKVEFIPIDVSFTISTPSRKTDVKNNGNAFLDNARRLDNQGKTDAALDLIFDQIDEMMLADQFAKVDQILKGLASDDYSTELLLGILTITLPAKRLLSYRQKFFQQVEQTLHRRGEKEDGLLFGLN